MGKANIRMLSTRFQQYELSDISVELLVPVSPPHLPVPVPSIAPLSMEHSVEPTAPPCIREGPITPPGRNLAGRTLYPEIEDEVVLGYHQPLQPDNWERNDLLEDIQLPVDHASPPRYESVAATSPSSTNATNSPAASSFHPADENLDVLNRTIKDLQSTPVHKRTLRSKRGVVQTAFKLQDRLNASILSAAPIDVTPARLTARACRSCDWLVSEFKKRFPTINDRREQYKMLTCTPLTMTSEELKDTFGVIPNIARTATHLKKTVGPFSMPPLGRTGPYKVTEEVRDLIIEFFMRYDVSRVNPAARETVLVFNKNLGKRVRESKRQILMSREQLYLEFSKEYPHIKLSISTVMLQKPLQCKWPERRGFQRTCLCHYHQNFHLLLNAIGIKMSTGNFLNSVYCDPSQDECYFGVCQNCPKKDDLYKVCKAMKQGRPAASLEADAIASSSSADREGSQAVNDPTSEEDEEDSTQITYYQWTSSRDERTTLTKMSGTAKEIVEIIFTKLGKMGKHHFILKKQDLYFQQLKGVLKEENAMMVHLDFAENYDFVVREEVQGFHWTKNQLTLHPFYCVWADQEAPDTFHKHTFMSMSDCLEHNASVIEAFRRSFMEKFISKHQGWLKKIYFISDGTGAQYKNYKNFINLMQYENKYHIKVEAHFTVSYHGKSECDAKCAVTKRLLRQACLRDGNIILTSEQAYAYCSQNMCNETQEFDLVPKIDIEALKPELEKLYETAKTIPGTSTYHSFIPIGPNRIETRVFSLSNDFKNHSFGRDLEPQPEPIVERLEVDQMPVGQPEPQPSILETIQLGSYLVFKILRSFKLGLTTAVNREEQIISVRPMTRLGKGNSFQWPSSEAVVPVPSDDVIMVVNAPVTATGRIYNLERSDYETMQKTLTDLRKK
jgi:hypothetical protein